MSKLDGLAARFKKAIDAEEQRLAAEEKARREAEVAAARAVEDDKKRRAQAKKARKALLDEVTALAKAIGLATKSNASGLSLTYKDRTLLLDAADDDRLGLVFDGAASGDNISLEDSGEWTITRVIDGFGRNQTLEEGLEDLLVDALHLPSPDGKAPAAPARPAPAAPAPAKAKKVAAKPAPEPETPKAEPRKKAGKRPAPGGAVKDLSNPWD